MDRRTFLKSSTAAAALPTGAAVATTSPAPNHEPGEHRGNTGRYGSNHLRLATPRHALLRDAADHLGERLRQVTGGLIAIEWHETSSDPASVRDLITTGERDGAFGIAPDLLDEPGLSLFAGLPGSIGLTPDQLLAWHTIAGGNMLLDEIADGIGVKVLTAGHSGAQPGLWATRDLADLRDVAATGIEAAGLGRLVWDHISEPFANPIPDARATEFPADPVIALRDARSADLKYLFRDGLHEHGFALSLVLSRDAWDCLDRTSQAVLAAVASDATHQAVAVAAYNRRAILPAIAKAEAIHVRPMPGILRQAIDHTAIEITRDVIVQDPRFSGAWFAYAAFHRDMTGRDPLQGHGPASNA